ncbi:MAG: DUF86 domain-containing protein [Pseudomonadota bacterium]
MTVDRVRVEAFLTTLRDAVVVLRGYGALPQVEFLASVDRRGSARYHLVVAAEAALDVGTHMISRCRWRTPRGYADVFLVLVENGALDPDLGQRLMRLAGLRNRLVHRYWDADDGLIHAWLGEELDYLEHFIGAVARTLQGGG